MNLFGENPISTNPIHEHTPSSLLVVFQLCTTYNIVYCMCLFALMTKLINKQKKTREKERSNVLLYVRNNATAI